MKVLFHSARWGIASRGWAACLPAACLPAACLPACASETAITQEPPALSPTPFPDPGDAYGDPPDDWSSCPQGFQGYYFNLPETHPDVEPTPAQLDEGIGVDALDWWDSTYYSFQRYDATLDFGTGWWPVDADLSGDPKYFSVYWTAWIRFYSREPVSVSLGSATDAWIYVDGVEIAALPGVHAFETRTFEWTPADVGEYPLEVYFAHRAGDESGFRLRLSGDDVALCYPDFGE